MEMIDVICLLVSIIGLILCLIQFIINDFDIEEIFFK
jgi:hypothetical protein